MAKKTDRLKGDIKRLVDEGELLEFALMKQAASSVIHGSELQKQLRAVKPELLKTLPSFNHVYEAWYSESLALLKQLLPARVGNFTSLYERPKNRKGLTFETYVIQDALSGLSAVHGPNVLADSSAAVPLFRQQLAIVKAAERRFESSIFEIAQLVRADLFDSEIAAARELLKHKFLRAAGAIAGVVLEKHLLQVCVDHEISILKKNPGIGDLNELLKSNSAIEVPQWRQIGMLADIRNICVHNKSKEPSAEQVGDLIDGTDKMLKTVA